MTPILQRATTQYSPEDDRIRIAGVTEDGRQMVVWLTRRLLGRLLPLLLEHLEKQFDTASAEHWRALQEFAQQAACHASGGSPAVVSGRDDAAILAASVDVTPAEAGVMLVFRSASGGAACLPLTSGVLRRWLHILYQADCAADWRLPQWPAWLTGAAAAVPALAMH
jgi:hypothetical protein